MPGAHKYGLTAKVHLSAGAGSPAYAGREIAISVINARPTRRVLFCLPIISVSYLPGYFAFFSSSLGGIAPLLPTDCLTMILRDEPASNFGHFSS
jgi:hypothetical protein